MKTCIFDLDGTLLNTLTDLAAAVNHALKKNDLPQRTLEEIRWMVGNGVRVLMQRAVPEGEQNPTFERIFQDFKDYYKLHSMDYTNPYEGIIELLAELKKERFRLAVVSNKADAATKPLVMHFFGEYIDVAIGEHAKAARKPAPDMIFHVMEQLGCEKSDCIYIGDSDVDIQTAKNAGIPCISVLWGFREREFLTEHGATLFAKHPHEILEILERLESEL